MNKVLRFKDINWSMPFLFANMSVIKLIYNIVGENHNIKYVYGAPKCIWNGGRLVKLNTNNMLAIEKIIEKCISFNTTPVFTFTNTSLDKKTIKDKFCNDLLKIIFQYNCQIITASDILHYYIKDKYPHIKQICSIINFGYEKNRNKNEIELINNFIKEYDRVVIRPELVIKNIDFLNEIDTIEKVELLVNQNCALNCPNSIQHYRLIEKLIWADYPEQKKLAETIKKMCPRQNGLITTSNNLSIIQIEKCISRGIKNLKLQGRFFTFNNILNELLNYYFSPVINKEELYTEIDKYIDHNSINNEKEQLKILFT